MQFYSRNEAINRINKLAGAGKAFLFIIDYKQECSFIEKVDDIDSSELLYNLNGFTNCTSVVTFKIPNNMAAPTYFFKPI